MIPLADPSPSGGAALISADPGALDRFAAGAGGRTQGVEPAAVAVDRAVAAWNHAPCDPRFQVHLEPLGDRIRQLGQEWTLADNYVADVAAAFRRADAGGSDIRYASQSAVDRSLRESTDYNPIASLLRGSAQDWARLVGDRCYVGGGRYTGGGFIIGPDSRRYPLVIPQIGKYNADDGGPGDMSTLDGADPGWFTTALYRSQRALFPTDSTDAALGAAIIALTGGKTPTGNASDPTDYGGLVLGDGRPQWYAHPVPAGGGNPSHDAGLGRLDVPRGSGPGGRTAPGPALTPGSAAATAALFPIAAVEQAAAVTTAERNGHYAAYQLRLERNLDGRVRAQLTLYALKKNEDGSRTIAPIGVTVGAKGVNGQLIHYRPRPEPTQPQAEPRADGKYHVLDHFADNDGFFADPNQPIKDVYQDR